MAQCYRNQSRQKLAAKTEKENFAKNLWWQVVVLQDFWNDMLDILSKIDLKVIFQSEVGLFNNVFWEWNRLMKLVLRVMKKKNSSERTKIGLLQK